MQRVNARCNGEVPKVREDLRHHLRLAVKKTHNLPYGLRFPGGAGREKEELRVRADRREICRRLSFVSGRNHGGSRGRHRGFSTPHSVRRRLERSKAVPAREHRCPAKRKCRDEFRDELHRIPLRDPHSAAGSVDKACGEHRGPAFDFTPGDRCAAREKEDIVLPLLSHPV